MVICHFSGSQHVSCEPVLNFFKIQVIRSFSFVIFLADRHTKSTTGYYIGTVYLSAFKSENYRYQKLAKRYVFVSIPAKIG